MGQVQRRNRWRKEAMGKARIRLICMDQFYSKDQVERTPDAGEMAQYMFVSERTYPSIFCPTWTEAPQGPLVQVVPVKLVDGVVQPEYTLAGVTPGPMFISQFGGFPPA